MSIEITKDKSLAEVSSTPDLPINSLIKSKNELEKRVENQESIALYFLRCRNFCNIESYITVLVVVLRLQQKLQSYSR